MVPNAVGELALSFLSTFSDPSTLQIAVDHQDLFVVQPNSYILHIKSTECRIIYPNDRRSNMLKN